MKVAFFDASGRLLLIADGVGMTPPDDAAYQTEVGPDATANNIYLDTALQKVEFKQAFPIAVSRNLVTGIPAGTEATFYGEPEIVNDGAIEFEADVEETLQITLEHPHFIYQVIAVETGP